MAGSDRFNKWLASLLQRQSLLAPEQADKGIAAAKEGGTSFAAWVVKEKIVEERQMLGLMSRETGIAPIDLEKVTPDEELIEFLSRDIAGNYGVFPISKLGNILTLAVSDPLDVLKLDDVRIITNSDIRPVLSMENRIREASDRLYNKRKAEMDALLAQDPGADMMLVKETEDDDLGDLAAIEAGNEDSPTVKFVNILILEAIQKRASDIHVEPMENRIRIRFRVDGILQEVHTLSRKMLAGIVSRIKIIGSMDIAEKGRPQDGMFQMKLDKRKVDFRVSIIPIVHGEKVVVRILDGSQLVMSLEGLGFEPRSLQDYRWAIKQPYGMILASGPSGSGKPTTL